LFDTVGVVTAVVAALARAAPEVSGGETPLVGDVRGLLCYRDQRDDYIESVVARYGEWREKDHGWHLITSVIL
jgi:hypothetical protein